MLQKGAVGIFFIYIIIIIENCRIFYNRVAFFSYIYMCNHKQVVSLVDNGSALACQTLNCAFSVS
jgi:hypothetical protein